MNTPIDRPLPELGYANTPHPAPPGKSRVPTLLLAGGFATVLGLLLVLGIKPRLDNVHALAAEAPSTAFHAVVQEAKPAESALDITLPSRVEAAQRAPLYSRVSGYVKELHTDIGSQVKAGDVLAVIETPELDEQVNQGRAALAQAAANLKLARTSFDRWTKLSKENVVAAQELDERRATLDARDADYQAAQANLDRLERQQEFQKIVAPFDGTVTKRFIEVGQLVTADVNDASRQLFELAHTATLRAFIDVPQSYFRLVAVGQGADLRFHELPGETYPARVVRTAGALDDNSRTLRTEVLVPNQNGKLVPGLYTEVTLHVERAQPPIRIASKSLILGSAGVQVAVLDEGNRVALRKVTIDRDLGDQVEIISGLTAGDRFVANPTDRLKDGATVEVEPAPKVAAK
ncbi:RND family efflux transporter, MFP subunit [Terrimicrobium sacchariphilum]|uniref:RND family efflux transporter, MFP subunit n=1 Tax=Terrimicrobium sacchariphilum TaxID=690879 RepID=A0A146G4V6_TERSA|nr:efflux RND transporter periplasmic adaptor subunit [Terrimicrobium sacchariphilum]GAT32054.1 RND family efflux transporter, MFP subunit [Terrimicrobium sacchariphilum]